MRFTEEYQLRARPPGGQSPSSGIVPIKQSCDITIHARKRGHARIVAGDSGSRDSLFERGTVRNFETNFYGWHARQMNLKLIALLEKISMPWMQMATTHKSKAKWRRGSDLNPLGELRALT
jgi:hypothetical protein